MTTYSSQPDETTGYDTFIANVFSDTNFNSEVWLGVGASATGGYTTTRTLIKFDLSTIPSGAVISSATLSLWTYNDQSSNTRNVSVYRLKRNWVETQATWNSYSTGNAWQTAGATGANDYDSSALATTSVAHDLAVGTEVQFALSTTEITKLIDGTYTNYGFLIMAATENADQWRYDASGSVTAGERPKLVIEYTAGGGLILWDSMG